MSAPQNPLLPPPEAKRRVARVPRDSLRRYNRWDSWKSRTALIAILLAGAWSLYPVLADDGESVISRGPVIAKHAAFENNCQACHVSFEPITGNAGGQRWPEWSTATDSKCLHCHRSTGAHSPQNEIYDKQHDLLEANCAVCHQDHQGRTANLKLVNDRHCTVCHANLADHMRGPTLTSEQPIALKIESFSEGHPKFRSIKTDPGKLKFNHQLHMSAGLPQTLKDEVSGAARKELPRQPFDLKRMAELGAGSGRSQQYEALYGTGKSVETADWIQLDCAACHERDRNNPKFAAAGLASGDPSTSKEAKNYLPIVFERHCVACHQLPYQAGLAGDPGAQVVHKSTPEQLERFVRNTVFTKLAQQSPELDERPKLNEDRRIPGNEPPTILSETQRKEAEEQIRRSAGYLTRTVCVECHTVSAESTLPRGKTLFPKITPTDIPRNWYAHAKFDHTPHVTSPVSADCRTCHEAAYADSSHPATTTATVMIPDLDNCVRCHAPSGFDSQGKAVGGAGSQCIECHAYHHADRPWPTTGNSVAPHPSPSGMERFFDLRKK